MAAVAGTLTSTASIILLISVSLSFAQDSVQIDGELSFARYANIEARQARIEWDPLVTFMPESANDFLSAFKAGEWVSKLDGPGDEQEQVLTVCTVTLHCLAA